MTKAELFTVWKRYMHRADLDADLETTYRLAVEKVGDRLMVPGLDGYDLDDSHDASFVHAGLSWLHRMAQDDNGMAREDVAFERAIQNWHIRSSLDTNPDAIATRPYVQEATDGN